MKKKFLSFLSLDILKNNETRKYFLACFILFICLIVMGYVLDKTEIIKDIIPYLIKKWGLEKNKLHGFDKMMDIFKNNTIVMGGMIITSFTIFPIIVFGINGIVIGAVFTEISSYSPISSFEFIALLSPHGMIEIPAIILTFALSCRVMKKFFKNSIEEFIVFYIKTLVVWSIVVIPALFLAAAIETFITPTLFSIIFR